MKLASSNGSQAPNNSIHLQNSMDGDDYDWDNLLSRFSYGEIEECRKLMVFDSLNNEYNYLTYQVGA